MNFRLLMLFLSLLEMYPRGDQQMECSGDAQNEELEPSELEGGDVDESLRRGNSADKSDRARWGVVNVCRDFSRYSSFPMLFQGFGSKMTITNKLVSSREVNDSIKSHSRACEKNFSDERDGGTGTKYQTRAGIFLFST